MLKQRNLEFQRHCNDIVDKFETGKAHVNAWLAHANTFNESIVKHIQSVH